MSLAFDAEPFARLAEIVAASSGAAAGSEPADQVRYLVSYLRKFPTPANTVLVERPYVDRHWMEEFAGFYSTQLHPPGSHATRLHVFASEFTTADFRKWILEAGSGKRAQVQKDLTSAYLGFIVVRPLPSAPVGRTILRAYGGDAARCYEPARTRSDVHLAGLRLEIEGLPFQQQDQGVGACATAAMWSSLSKVMRTDGQRPPTPLEITRAATRGRVVSRAFPAADGLNLEQMCSAIQAVGYSPHVFKKHDETALFLMTLKGYLRSGIPIIVVVNTDDGAHVTTFVGFRESTNPDDALAVETGKRFRLRGSGVVRFYVHDDRFGPYARIKYTETGDSKSDGELSLEPTEGGFEDLTSPMSFWHAIVPLYPKLRLTIEDLLEYAIELLPAMRYFAGEQRRDGLRVEPRLTLSGSYLTEVLDLQIDPDRKALLATTALFSRYVGVIRFIVGEDWFADFVYDGTDIRRDSPTMAPVLAVVAANPAVSAALKAQAANLRLGPRPVFA